MEDAAPQNPGGTFPPEMLKNEDTEETEEVVEETKDPYQSVEAVAKEVVDGRWGIGQARRIALAKAGYDPNEVNEEVKKLLNRR